MPFSEEESARFAAYTDRLLTHLLTSDGLTLHWFLLEPASFGITEYPETLGDFTLEGAAAEREWAREMLQELDSFQVGALTPEQQDFYRILQMDLSLDEEIGDMDLHSEPNGVLDGVQAQYPAMMADYRLETVEDVERYLVLLKDFPRVYQECLLFQQQKAAAGLFMPELLLDEVLRTGRELTEAPEESFMITTFSERLDGVEGLTDQQRQAFEAQNRQIWVEEVVPATEALLEGLDSLREYCTPSLGMVHQTDGKRYYELVAQSTTGSDWTVEEMVRRVDSQLEEAVALMNSIIRQNQSAAREAIALQENPPDLGSPEEMLELLRTAFEEEFAAIGQVEVQIKEVPDSLRESSAPASYLRPPLDSPTQNVIYINSAKTQDSLDLFTTLAHEGYPGHLYQNNYFLAKNTIPVRSILSYSGYSEGWATYCELKSYEKLGVSPEAAQLLAANHLYSLLITCRVDLGIHYDGWDKMELWQFLNRNGIDAQETVDAAYLQMLDDPAGSLPYAIGYLKFVELENQARQRLGADFDPAAYYQVILDCGPAPFAIVKEKVADYIAAVQAGEEERLPQAA